MKRILVVDDQEDIRLMLRLVLENEGWAVEEATSAEEALHACLSRAPFAVIMDQKMPGGTGIEAARAIRAKGFGFPILLYSAYLSTDVEREAGEVGVTVVSKDDLTHLMETLGALPAGADGSGGSA